MHNLKPEGGQEIDLKTMRNSINKYSGGVILFHIDYTWPLQISEHMYIQLFHCMTLSCFFMWSRMNAEREMDTHQRISLRPSRPRITSWQWFMGHFARVLQVPQFPYNTGLVNSIIQENKETVSVQYALHDQRLLQQSFLAWSRWPTVTVSSCVEY